MLILIKKYINLFISITLITLFCSLNLYCNTKIYRESFCNLRTFKYVTCVLKKDTNSPIYLDCTNIYVNFPRLMEGASVKQYAIHVIGCDDEKRNGAVDCTINDGGQYYIVDRGKKYLLYNDVIEKNKKYVYIFFTAIVAKDECNDSEIVKGKRSYINWSADVDEPPLDCIVLKKCNVPLLDVPYCDNSNSIPDYETRQKQVGWSIKVEKIWGFRCLHSDYMLDSWMDEFLISCPF